MLIYSDTVQFIEALTMRTVIESIPVFKIYEETVDWPTTDLLLWEALKDRCQQHHYKINPHRHNDLIQVFYLQQGEMNAQLDGNSFILKAPCIMVVPAMCVHDFSVTSNVNGHVLSLTSPLTQKLGTELNFLDQLLKNPSIYPVSQDQDKVGMLFEAIMEEYQNLQMGREQSLEALLKTLMIWIGRLGIKRSTLESRMNRSNQHLTAFSQLVELHFKTHQPLKDYAKELNITAKHLNATCQQLTQKSSLHIIHQRLLLEAKRNLIYTAMTISEISYSLGFSEPAYFTRFFKRLTGTPPKEFRIKQKIH